MDFVLQDMNDRAEKQLNAGEVVVDDDIPDCEDWEESLYQKKVEVRETAWESYNSNLMVTVEAVQDDYKKNVRKLASDWSINMPRDLYLQKYGTSSEQARLQGYLFVRHHGEYPFPCVVNLGGRLVDAAFSIPCTLAPATLTHVGDFCFPHTDVYVSQFKGMTQVTAYQENHWQGTLILNTMDIPLGWQTASNEGSTITIGNRLITVAARGFLDTVYWEVNVQDISHPYIKGAFLEPTTIVPDLFALTDIEGSTYLDEGASKVYMPIAATAVVFRGQVVTSKQYFDRSGEEKVLASRRFLGLNDDSGQQKWTSDLLKLAHKVPIYAKDPSLEVRALHSILHPGSTSSILRQNIKAVGLNTHMGFILSPSATVYHLSCSRFDHLKRYYVYSGPVGVGKGHDPLSEITIFGYHSWINTLKLISREQAVKKGVSLLIRSSANDIIYPPYVGLTKLVPHNSIGKNYSQVPVNGPAQIAQEEIENIKLLIRSRSIDGLSFWPRTFAKPLIDNAEYSAAVCQLVKPLIVAAMFSGKLVSGEGPPGSITFVSPCYSGVTIKKGVVYIRSKHAPHSDPIFHALPDIAHPCYSELYAHMFYHSCIPE